MPHAQQYYPLSNYFGVNVFEWDFEGAPDVSIPDTARTKAIKNFTQVRHYLDWDKVEPQEGLYTFNPTKNGTWNLDTIYGWCAAQHIDVLVCLKTVPDWMLASYPADQRDKENIPMRYGKDPKDPASYVEQAKAAYQVAARYGHNGAVPANTVSTGYYNSNKTDLGLIRYIECDNERDKWWKGRKAQQTAEEYAANLSAFYDGDKGKLGPHAGVKNADPAMQVVMGGLAKPDPAFVKRIVAWSIKNRGKRADGSPDLPFDVINYHYYCNDASYTGGRQTTGKAPELSNAAGVAGDFVGLAIANAGNRPVWITECGYDINQQSPQRAEARNGTTARQVQANWLLRTCLLYARTGIDRVFIYELADDNPNTGTIYATSGLVETPARTNRPAADYLYQTNKLFGKYVFARTISTNPYADEYTCDGKKMYAVWSAGEKGNEPCTLHLASAREAYIYEPVAGEKDMSVQVKKIASGALTIEAIETPQFITTEQVQTKQANY